MALLDELKLPFLIMHQENVHIPSLPVSHGNARPAGDHIQGYVMRLVELVLDQVKKASILQAGGGRKPWAEKGTGRARQGTIRAPHWRGGGIVFGPTPRSYAQKMNRKMRRLALRSALSVKASENQLVVVDQMTMDAVKTREMVSCLDRLGVDSSVLMLLPERNEMVELSARNLPYVKVQRATNLSVRDLLGYDYVMVTRGAVEQIEGILG